MARYEQASVQAYVSLAVLNAGQAAIFTVGLAVDMVMCVYGIKHGTSTIGDFVMINAMMIQLYQPLNFMGMVYREIKQAVIDIEKMFAILGREPEIKDDPARRRSRSQAARSASRTCTSPTSRRGRSSRASSFEVPAGRTVAIVGPSGAGKSTISRLLFRFYEVTGGRITIDGQDIRDVTQNSLRAAIGMVPQDTVLFNDTMRYNIRYGRWDATDAEVEEAARLAQIDGFIRSSPKGYDTEVGERGLKLSGGEKQRVAIARTILKAPPILLLDEATSALDSHTEKEIQDALDRVSANRTTLVIAHRLSTIIGADEIIVLDQGVIVERGTHQRCWPPAGSMPACGTGSARPRRRARSSRSWARMTPRPTAIRRRRSTTAARGATPGMSAPPTLRSEHVDRRLDPLAARSDHREGYPFIAAFAIAACSCSGCGRRSAGSAPSPRCGASISSVIRRG